MGGANRIGLSDRDIVEMFTLFSPLAYWRVDLDTGHVFGCEDFNRLFGLPHSDGPVDMIALASRIHPQDLASVMEIFEAASVRPMSYQDVFQATSDGRTYRYMCAMGRFRAKQDTSGEIVGLTYEIPPHRYARTLVPQQV
jgi:hypothetical protein